MTQVLCEFCGRHYQISGPVNSLFPSEDGAYHLECCDQCVTEYSNQKFKEAQEIDWLRRLYALKDMR